MYVILRTDASLLSNFNVFSEFPSFSQDFHVVNLQALYVSLDFVVL